MWSDWETGVDRHEGDTNGYTRVPDTILSFIDTPRVVVHSEAKLEL